MSSYLFDNVTSWSARLRHLTVKGSSDMLCARGTVVRPGGRNARPAVPMTQDRIDAMPMCQACNTSARRIESGKGMGAR